MGLALERNMKVRKAFTLIELTVSIGLLALVISFASVIFRVSIEGYRTASANAEIMQKLRAVTDQFNRDFGGLQTDAPLLIWFEREDPNRYDQIMFFANGDFQSTQLYSDTSGEPDEGGDKLLVGNVARVFYGQAQSLDEGGSLSEPSDLDEPERLLARRQHILTADEDIKEWPDYSMLDFDLRNEWYEHDSLSLAEWKTIETDKYDSPIIPFCFDERPFVSLELPDTFHKLMCEGVGSFAIQWAYWDEDEDRLYWFPSDSHFSSIDDEFGVYFNMPGLTSIGGWHNPFTDAEFTGEDFALYPKAFKFTFTLYDSKGILDNGRTFTHIVCIGG